VVALESTVDGAIQARTQACRGCRRQPESAA
jgi:hypothetical protein